MLEMALVSEKRLKYVGNEGDMLEMAKIWEMTYVLNIRLKYVGNDLEIWRMAKIFV